VLQEVNLHFTNGATAIVGHSGSGKSTVAQLLTQVIQPSEGSIKLGDVCMHDISRDWIRQHVAEVPQVRPSSSATAHAVHVKC
jgi:ABC-type bacteriocin/lantibiotic exporter with double-glycine peptidase domain